MTTVFISYSRKDKPWKDCVKKSLDRIREKGVQVWDDGILGTGAQWEKQVLDALRRADVAIFLISNCSLKPGFIRDQEIPLMQELRAKGQLHIFPLLVRPCAWKNHAWLADLQVKPGEDMALSTLGKDKCEKELAELATEVSLYTPPSRIAARLFGALGLGLLGLSLLGYYYYLRTGPTGPCQQAEKALAEIAPEISPVFPDLMCRAPIPDPQEPIPWSEIERKLVHARPLINTCASLVGIPGRGLRGRLFMVEALRVRAKRTTCETDDCYWNYDAQYKNFERQAAGQLGKDDPLVLLRQLTDLVDHIADVAQANFCAGKDPCGTIQKEQQWRNENQAADRVMEALALRRDSLSDHARGCAWMLRAEQAYWQAGVCREGREGDIARRAQALVSFARVAKLATRFSPVFSSVEEVVRPGPDLNRMPVSAAQRQKLADLALTRLRKDADQLGDEEMKYRSNEVAREVSSLLGDRKTRLALIPKKYFELVPSQERNFSSICHHTDSLIANGRPEQAFYFLTITVPENDENTRDFRYQVLKGKALCFNQQYESSLASLNAAMALEEPKLGERWGCAEFLAPICKAAAGKLTRRKLRESVERLAPEHVKHVQQEVCDILQVAPTLVDSLRRRGDAWVFNELGAHCERGQTACSPAAQ